MTARQAVRRHNPLDEDLLARGLLRQKAPKRKAGGDKDGEGEGYIDSKASKRILELGRELEVEGDEKAAGGAGKQQLDAFGFGTRFEEEEEEAPFDDQDDQWADEDDAGGDGTGEIDPADLATFDKFLPSQQEDDPILKHLSLRMSEKMADEEDGSDHMDEAEQPAQAGRNLADIILAKIAEHEAGPQLRPVGDGAFDEEGELDLNPKVVEVYAKCGILLSRWKSGKLPKPLKILPTVPQWETLVEITQPEQWTANACEEMTKIFISAKAEVGRRFMEMVILDRVRDDIRDTKKLNVHLFAALKKSLFRPAAFFKGFLFPLVLSGTTTLREAQIISAALVRTSIPVLHSGAALKGLCDISAELSPDTEGQSAISVFIKALLDKRYALPYQV